MTKQGNKIIGKLQSWESQGVVVKVSQINYFYPFANIRVIKMENDKH